MNTSALNRLNRQSFVKILGGIFEHSPWVASTTWEHGPFASTSHLHTKMCAVMHAASRGRKLALLRAHPELAGKAMVAKSLTADSTHEQTRSGLTQCSPEEFATLQRLNAAYNKKFGWPFILAVKHLDRATIIATFKARLEQSADAEFTECLANIEKITGWRLADLIQT